MLEHTERTLLLKQKKKKNVIQIPVGSVPNTFFPNVVSDLCKSYRLDTIIII